MIAAQILIIGVAVEVVTKFLVYRRGFNKGVHIGVHGTLAAAISDRPRFEGYVEQLKELERAETAIPWPEVDPAEQASTAVPLVGKSLRSSARRAQILEDAQPAPVLQPAPAIFAPVVVQPETRPV